MSAALCHGEAAAAQQFEIKQIEGGIESEGRKIEKRKEERRNKREREREDDKKLETDRQIDRERERAGD